MALIICKNCGRQYSNRIPHCPQCGAPSSNSLDITSLTSNNINQTVVQKDEPKCNTSLSDSTFVKSTKKRTPLLLLLFIVFIIIAVLGSFFVIHLHNDKGNEEEEETVTDTFPDTTRVRNVLNDYSHAIMYDDFNSLTNLYAPFVERYMDAYNETRLETIGHHKRYNDFFGVYGKHISYRWETLQIKPADNDKVEVIIVEDYTIDRYDESKYSIFVIEKHFVLNRDYCIVKEWDVQIHKSKKY